jgi:hypothetical protein
MTRQERTAFGQQSFESAHFLLEGAVSLLQRDDLGVAFDFWGGRCLWGSWLPMPFAVETLALSVTQSHVTLRYGCRVTRLRRVRY